MSLLRLTVGCLLAGAPVVSLAQSTEPAPAPRFYGGLALYSSYYQRLGGGAYRSTRIPVQLTAGYQWRPRLAVQAGLAYSGNTDRFFGGGYSYTGTSTQGNYFDYNGHTTLRIASVSLLARYTLTRKLAHRVQFDVLGGLGWEYRSNHSYGSRADSVQNNLVVSPYDYTTHTERLLVSLGPSIRCRFGSHLELVYNYLISTSPTSNQYYQAEGITDSQALGLRYRFGRH